MNILENIVQHTIKEVKLTKEIHPTKKLEQTELFSKSTNSLKSFLIAENETGIIAEFKRQSPSKGIINSGADISETTYGYINAGATALSVLTNNKYFGGNISDILQIRSMITRPILRKEFIIDEYQIIEAKSIGADVILLIAAILPAEQILRFTKLAKSLNLEILLEIHNQTELAKINDLVDFVGVNNRDLTTFKVDLNTSVMLAKQIPDSFIKISESGINKPENIIMLKNEGFKGFLIGEQFMHSPKPEIACKEFINKVKLLTL